VPEVSKIEQRGDLCELADARRRQDSGKILEKLPFACRFCGAPFAKGNANINPIRLPLTLLAAERAGATPTLVLP